MIQPIGKSDKGCVRPTNQDAFAIAMTDTQVFLVVCDGMGGANAGNVASKFAVDSFMQGCKQSCDAPVSDWNVMLQKATEKANATVYALSLSQADFAGMGTTLVGGVIAENMLYLAHVGDSRAYLMREGTIQQITTDHSYVEDLIAKGKISREDARYHPNKNLITRAVGVAETVEIDCMQIKLQPKDILLLCSDGLTGMLEDEAILHIVETAPSLEQATDTLLFQANEAGGVDNITAVLYAHETKGEEG